ncbi:unnamed protein product [Caenorhabditis auriculariae]|uniref:Uncharacterized protein n=1 Tax=Caenorhabditis auriculariae TaxID=2777116 RepID=A0A8S1GP87_9PELO|nr:unnamed protein product [Caenorhabditis auriculariae]
MSLANCYKQAELTWGKRAEAHDKSLKCHSSYSGQFHQRFAMSRSQDGGCGGKEGRQAIALRFSVIVLNSGPFHRRNEMSYQERKGQGKSLNWSTPIRLSVIVPNSGQCHNRTGVDQFLRVEGKKAARPRPIRFVVIVPSMDNGNEQSVWATQMEGEETHNILE